MSFNGSGTFVINSSGQPVVANTVISTTVFNALTADLATGLSTCVTKDGQTIPTANLPMGTFKLTNLGVGSAATDSATLGQVQASTTKLSNGIGYGHHYRDFKPCIDGLYRWSDVLLCRGWCEHGRGDAEHRQSGFEEHDP
jgi:hypothetical protein